MNRWSDLFDTGPNQSGTALFEFLPACGLHRSRSFRCEQRLICRQKVLADLPALTDAERAKYYALAQQRVTEEHLWMPVMNVAMYTTSLKKLKGVRPHMLYQNTFYKGLDYSF
jgi:hypothetical protein